MEFCHQKHKHCFVACCAALLGKSDIVFQESIVDRFQDELQKGTDDEGVPKSPAAVINVLNGLRLSKDPSIVQSTSADFTDMPLFIHDNASDISRMIIGTQFPTKHCMLIKELVVGGMTVMDPSHFDFSFLNWQEFTAMKPEIILL
jgi:hypothetical protein